VFWDFVVFTNKFYSALSFLQRVFLSLCDVQQQDTLLPLKIAEIKEAKLMHKQS